MPNDDEIDYVAMAEHELALAGSAADQGDKIRHLNRATFLATLNERSRAPHRLAYLPE